METFKEIANIFRCISNICSSCIYFNVLPREKWKVKVEKSNVIRYLTLNVVAGYSMVLLVASIYVFGVAGYGFDVFNYWLGIILMLFVSWFALFLFYKMNLIVKIQIKQLML